LTLALLASALVIGAEARAQPEWRFDGIERIVAVADIHGAYGAFEKILKQARVIDDSLAWTAGATHLVIVGDVLDRGPQSRRALELIMQLEGQARAAGGRVHMVLGNHEIMNMTGDLRYVSAAEYAAFADDETPAMRDAAFLQLQSREEEQTDAAAARADFDARFAPGFFAHRAAFAAGGRYGEWLLQQPILLLVNDWAFVHAGIAATAGATTGAAINGELLGQLTGYAEAMKGLTAAGVLNPTDDFYDHPAVLARFASAVESGRAQWPEGAEALAQRAAALNAAPVFAPDSPVWYRGNVGCSELTEEDELLEVLHALGARQLVIGHTPTNGATVQSRMEQQLLRLDTGMLNPYYGGRAAALIVEGDHVSVLYENEAQAASPVPQPDQVGAYPAGMSSADLERFLETAGIVSKQDSDTRWQQVTLRESDVELNAYFTPAERANVRPDVAAYRLDRMLDLQMVPVTVAREIDGVPGSLQYAPPQVITETDRVARSLGGGAWCPLGEQFDSMYVFDSLIYNRGRTPDRIRYRLDNMQLLLVGHDVSFSTDGGRPAHLASVALQITADWADALRGLDTASLTETLGDVLDKRRIRALLTRRDAILESAAAQ
jgi:hypothetical protein